MEKPHKKLDVWKSALDLVAEIYKVTRLLPGDEKYNLSSQMKQAAVSVPANIAEGAARNTKKEFANFLHIAQGSLSELDTHIEVAKRLDYFKEDMLTDTDLLMNRIDKMLTGLIRRQKQ
jgi:four helix bundle protein